MKVPWETRFWSKVSKGDDEECWTWQGYIPKHRKLKYGVMNIGTKRYRAHRLAFALANKVDPSFEGWVLHRCDNPSCCNPSHLFLGDHIQNMYDMRIKGRGHGRSLPDQRYENNYNAKLNMAKVTEIRSLISEGKSNKKIAELFGVTHQTISCIRRGLTWK